MCFYKCKKCTPKKLSQVTLQGIGMTLRRQEHTLLPLLIPCLETFPLAFRFNLVEEAHKVSQISSIWNRSFVMLIEPRHGWNVAREDTLPTNCGCRKVLMLNGSWEAESEGQLPITSHQLWYVIPNSFQTLCAAEATVSGLEVNLIQAGSCFRFQIGASSKVWP